MRRFFAFWWLAARNAFWGNTAFANDWQWLVGVPATAGIITFISAKTGATDLSTGAPILDGLIVAAGAFVITWAFSFGIRFLNQPVVLFHQEKDRAEAYRQRLEGMEAPRRDAWFQHAVFYILHRRWPEKAERIFDSRMSCESENAYLLSIKAQPTWSLVSRLLVRIRQLAADGKLQVWTQYQAPNQLIETDFLAPFVPLDSSFWLNNRVQPEQLLGRPSEVCATEKYPFSLADRRRRTATALMVSKAQVEAIWPRDTVA